MVHVFWMPDWSRAIKDALPSEFSFGRGIRLSIHGIDKTFWSDYGLTEECNHPVALWSRRHWCLTVGRGPVRRPKSSARR